MSSQFKEKIDRLIISSPFREPNQHWKFDKTKGKFFIKDGRRSAGYVIASQSTDHQESGHFVEFPLVNKIRLRVKDWKNKDYPGATAITKRLLDFWNTKNADGRDCEFFFCQKEAIETLIWLTEAHSSERVGVDIPKDGGDFNRLCSKMATGTGKTYVMAMTIAWQILNKISYPADDRFSKYVFIVAPNLTVKDRLSVLKFNASENYYEDKKIVPYELLSNLRQGKILIENWHSLMWDSEEALQKRKSVDKRGVKSDEAYIRDILGDMSRARKIVVINDEAHHAWRHRSEDKQKTGIKQEEKDMATCWIQGLDRIHRSRGILNCFDFSATPFSPSGTKARASYEEDMFAWIVSDFGLMDAVESGLTKTPRFVVRDDGPINPKDFKSKLNHIYNDEDVKQNLNKKANKEEILPELVRSAYLLLSYDWEKTLVEWGRNEMPTPPVMISAVNRKETADRIKYMFDKKRINIPELCVEDKTVLIYSDLSQSKEGSKEKGTDKELRERVNTVGQIKKPGEQIRHIISVAMLSEGWNCQTVTHIMGLRAFSSQLLCEQIIGRGLRRTSYELNEDGLFEPEYVNIFGIPFSFIPQEDFGTEGSKPPSPKLPIFPDPEKERYKIIWPHIERIDFDLKPILQADFSKVESLEISEIRTIADLAPKIDGKPDYERIETINMEKLVEEKDIRLQRLMFEAATNVYDQVSYGWKDKINTEFALSQLFKIVDEFLVSDKFQIKPKSFHEDETKRKIAIMMGMEQIVRKIFSVIVHQNLENLTPVYRNPKYRSTKDTPEWRTGKETAIFNKTHMNRCVVDSSWELAHARELDRNPNVEAWVKNDHLGFEIYYIHSGGLYRYVPDFIARLSDKSHLVLEVKGVEKQKDKSKWDYMETWVKAVNQDEENGVWYFDVSKDDTGKKVHEIIKSIINKTHTKKAS